MKKIMFNDSYGLTQAVIEGRKTVTRRIEGSILFQGVAYCADEILYNEDNDTLDIWCDGIHILSQKPRYTVGEVVAVAQSYNDATREFPHLKTTLVGDDITGSEPGCTNKMYVKADLMPNRIHITGIRCERLQDISDEDCLKEGIRFIPEIDKFYFEDVRREEGFYFNNHRTAFASLIDKVSGRGTWKRNPWVMVYEFELVK